MFNNEGFVRYRYSLSVPEPTFRQRVAGRIRLVTPMAETTDVPAERLTEHVQDGTIERAAGGWLALGSLLMILGGALHPPSASAVAVIAENMTRWIASHWLFAAGSFLVGVAGFLLLLARSEVASEWGTKTSWAAVVLGTTLLVIFLAGEATVLPALAAAGETEAFANWKAFIESGVFAALFPVTVGLMGVAWSQARHPAPRTPAFAAWGGVLTFALGLVWIVGSGVLGIDILGPLFLVELLGFIWLGWLGVRLLRLGELEDGGSRPTVAAYE